MPQLPKRPLLPKKRCGEATFLLGTGLVSQDRRGQDSGRRCPGPAGAELELSGATECGGEEPTSCTHSPSGWAPIDPLQEPRGSGCLRNGFSFKF